MKKKVLALLLAGSMLFGQNVYATDMVSTEKTDVTENADLTENVKTAENVKAAENRKTDDAENMEITENTDAIESMDTTEEVDNSESNDITESTSETEQDSEAVIAHDTSETDNDTVSGTKQQLSSEDEQLYSQQFDGKIQIAYVDNPFSFPIRGFYGWDKYSVTSSDESVCKVSINGRKYDTGVDIDIEPLREGTVTFNLIDEDGKIKYEEQIEVRKDLPEDAAPIKDIKIRKALLSEGTNSQDGYISMDELKKLERLRVYSDDYSGLEYADNLKELTFLFNEDIEITDISSVSKLTQLKKLSIQYCKKLEDLSAISSLSNLQELYIQYCPEIEDLSAISNLPNLRKLHISSCDKIEDLSAISNLSNLQELDISSCYKIKDLSAISGLFNLKSLNIRNLDIIDISPISKLENLEKLSLSSCDKVNGIKPLYDLIEKNGLSVNADDINLSDDDKVEIAAGIIERNDKYIKGKSIYLPYGIKIEQTGGDGSIKFDANEIVMEKEGKALCSLTLNNSKRTVQFNIDGTDAKQPVGKTRNLSIANTSYVDAMGGESSILTNNGDLWRIYPEQKKLQRNVKKYVGRWVYWGDYDRANAKLCDLRLDKNNVLWSGNEKILDNVKDVEGRYALKNDNTLVDIYHENGKSISDVKDWKEISTQYATVFDSMTLILKTDGTLWKKYTWSVPDSLSYCQIDSGVTTLYEFGYLKSNGDYIDYLDGGVAKNVIQVDESNGCIYFSDGYCSHYGYRFYVGNSRIKDAYGMYYILDNNQLYKCPGEKIADNIEKFVDSRIVENTKGEIFKIEDDKLVKTDKADKADKSGLVIADTNSGYGMLQRNGVDILSNVKYVWDDFALRTDGTIWDVSGVPKMFLDLGQYSLTPGDVDGDEKVSTKDLMIVLYGVSGRNELTDDQTTAADIDGDGKVTVSDLTRILYYVSGRNSTL